MNDDLTQVLQAVVGRHVAANPKAAADFVAVFGASTTGVGAQWLGHQLAQNADSVADAVAPQPLQAAPGGGAKGKGKAPQTTTKTTTSKTTSSSGSGSSSSGSGGGGGSAPGGQPPDDDDGDPGPSHKKDTGNKKRKRPADSDPDEDTDDEMPDPKVLKSHGKNWSSRVWIEGQNPNDPDTQAHADMQAVRDDLEGTGLTLQRSPFVPYDPLIRGGGGVRKYVALANRFANLADGGASIAARLAEWMNGEKVKLPGDAQEFATITTLAETARGYSSAVDQLPDQMLAIADMEPAEAAAEWRRIKEWFVPSLTYQEDLQGPGHVLPSDPESEPDEEYDSVPEDDSSSEDNSSSGG